MRRTVLAFLLAAFISWPAAAAPAALLEAAEAYKKGDYAGVLAACKPAAEAGDASCQNFLGILYAEGKGVKADPAEAARWFRRAAEQGNGYAALNLGIAYQEGEGVPKDIAQAEKWLRQAAEQGIPQGQLLLGAIIFGVHKDPHEAAKWFRKAAAHGLPPAELALGVLYESGAGVRANPRTAARWFLAAAEHGLSAAQSRIAARYEHGDGVKQDLPEAYFWYAVALRDPADERRKSDEAALKRIAPKLAKAELDDAIAAARDFQPKAFAPGGTKRGRGVAAGDRNDAPALRATGSGFFVSRAGHLLTNNHVVAECRDVRVTEGEKSVAAAVLATDAARDLALLKLPHGVAAAAVFRGEPKARPGENVIVVGFPLAGILTTDPIVTTGIISALAGPRDDRRLMQISAPVQPGNSGGPLLDASGHVVGVIVATLSTIKLAMATGHIPENLNFAIKGDEAREFLRSKGVEVETAGSGRDLATAAVVDQALQYAVRLECWK